MDGSQSYQRKTVEQGPGYIKFEVTQTGGSSSENPNQQSFMSNDGAGGPPSFQVGGGSPESFFSMIHQAMQVIQQQRIANAMNQMLSQGLIFIPDHFIEYVEDDEANSTTDNSHSLMPYQGTGFLSFDDEEKSKEPLVVNISSQSTVQNLTKDDTNNATTSAAKKKKAVVSAKNQLICATILLSFVFVIILGTCTIMSKLSKQKPKPKKSSGITYLDELSEAAKRGIIGGGPPQNDAKRD